MHRNIGKLYMEHNNRTSTLSILGIYHPPDTNNYKFIDDITEKNYVRIKPT